MTRYVVDVSTISGGKKITIVAGFVFAFDADAAREIADREHGGMLGWKLEGVRVA